MSGLISVIIGKNATSLPDRMVRLSDFGKNGFETYLVAQGFDLGLWERFAGQQVRDLFIKAVQFA